MKTMKMKKKKKKREKEYARGRASGSLQTTSFGKSWRSTAEGLVRNSTECDVSLGSFSLWPRREARMARLRCRFGRGLRLRVDGECRASNGED